MVVSETGQRRGDRPGGRARSFGRCVGAPRLEEKINDGISHSDPPISTVTDTSLVDHVPLSGHNLYRGRLPMGAQQSAGGLPDTDLFCQGRGLAGTCCENLNGAAGLQNTANGQLKVPEGMHLKAKGSTRTRAAFAAYNRSVTSLAAYTSCVSRLLRTPGE